VLIEGEAGIGKTRLLKELETHAQHQGVQVCYGRCYEDLTLPYLPFVESLLLLLEQEFGEVNSPLDADVEIIHWFRHPHKTIPLTASSSPSIQIEQEKLRLFLAVSRITLKLAQRRPLCFLLDDLHWADHPSLELFGHLIFSVVYAAAQGSIPLLIVATYRP
jgi:predicted ATPase